MSYWMERAREEISRPHNPPLGETVETSKDEVLAVSAAPQGARSWQNSVSEVSTKSGREIGKNKRYRGKKTPRASQKLRPIGEEALLRFEFCEAHRHLLGGICRVLDSGGLEECLLWQLISHHNSLVSIGHIEVLPEVTVADAMAVLEEIDSSDLPQSDRRWILCAAAMIQGVSDTVWRLMDKLYCQN